MKAFVCVYLHYEPSKKAKTLTQAAAATDPNLRQFLADYDRPNAFWDWGDDPGFYSASRILDSPLKASWGVCAGVMYASSSKAAILLSGFVHERIQTPKR
jgi:hypothetical protein